VKFDSLRSNWRLWLLGLVVALAGVVIARVAAPHATGKTQTMLISLGRLVSFAGLFVIALGIKRRAQTTDKDNAPKT
jgi:peptidoglycan/LPS O-acetylase OafA/YrhL